MIGLLLFSSLQGIAKRKVELEKIYKGPIDQVEAFIDESSMQLSVEFERGNDNADILVMDFEGTVIFSENVYSGEFIILPSNKQTEYILYVSVGGDIYKGFFSIK